MKAEIKRVYMRDKKQTVPVEEKCCLLTESSSGSCVNEFTVEANKIHSVKFIKGR